MRACVNASIPQHRYGYVCKEILYGLDAAFEGQFEPCVLFGITSIPSRALHFSILCESGAQWARIPLHLVRHACPEPGAPEHALTDLQQWDAFGYDFGVVQYAYLREMACQFRALDGRWIQASYWFTIDHFDNGYSDCPSQHKCYHLLLLEDGSGQIAAMPNNRVVWHDQSFVKPGHPFNYRTMAPETWHAEYRPTQPHLNPQDTALTTDYDAG